MNVIWLPFKMTLDVVPARQEDRIKATKKIIIIKKI